MESVKNLIALSQTTGDRSWHTFITQVDRLRDLDVLMRVRDGITLPIDPDENIAWACAGFVSNRMVEVLVQQIDNGGQSARMLGMTVKYFDHHIAAGMLAADLGRRTAKLEGERAISKHHSVLYAVIAVALTIHSTGVDGSEVFFHALDE